MIELTKCTGLGCQGVTDYTLSTRHSSSYSIPEQARDTPTIKSSSRSLPTLCIRVLAPMAIHWANTVGPSRGPSQGFADGWRRHSFFLGRVPKRCDHDDSEAAYNDQRLRGRDAIVRGGGRCIVSEVIVQLRLCSQVRFLFHFDD